MNIFCKKNYCNENPILVNLKFGFTLVELLVVVAIIGILATLITAAAFRVIATTRVTTIRMNIAELEQALELYKNKFGEYPPNTSDIPAMLRHIRKRWPRCNVTSALDTSTNPPTPIAPITVNGQNISSMTLANNALLFWLGGFRNSDGKYCGFNVDKEHPFHLPSGATATNGGSSTLYDNEVFIELVEGVNVTGINGVNYIVSRDAPIVYFRGTKGGGPNAYDSTLNIQFAAPTEFGDIVPYKKDSTKWHNPETFQLIHPGLDGIFGTGTTARQTNDSTGLTDPDYDNITNLGTSTIEALLP
ncbi:MAG: prepilin-type N-terminal cleavage/methylation domain-containing protein [Planctomycetaceae bacterium]|jgi:prepilin-type N-terminal cleavage/methylation domain-containing protein|nr:prepilin-type N-terminal cleavage/methylation domain-containing protein [Planctomycetaceae bacterium]